MKAKIAHMRVICMIGCRFAQARLFNSFIAQHLRQALADRLCRVRGLSLVVEKKKKKLTQKFLQVTWAPNALQVIHNSVQAKNSPDSIWISQPKQYPIAWWRHRMETFSALLAICAGNSPVPVNSPHKGQWRGALVFSLICVWIHDRVNNREAGDLRRYRAHHDVTVMAGHISNPTNSATVARLGLWGNLRQSGLLDT